MELRPDQWMSHELRTLLTLLAAPLERLEQRWADDPPSLELLAVARGYMEVVGRLGDALVDDHPTNEGDVSTAENMRPSEVVSQVAGQLRHMALEFGLGFDIVTTVASNTPVSCDVPRLSRMASTLVELSVRRTIAPGRVAVSVDCPRPGEVLVSVESSQSMRDLPLPFTTRLERLRAVAERLGGRVDSYDLAMGGAMLEMRIPVQAARDDVPCAPRRLETVEAPRSDADRPAAAHEDLRAPVVVVVDDEPHILAMWVKVLRRAFCVYAAADGQEGLRTIRRVQPDLILTDNVMPVMGGPELITELRSDPALCDIPIIAATACVTPELRNAMRLAGPGETLVKPIRPVDLLAKATVLATSFRAQRAERVADHTDPLTGLLTAARLRTEIARCLAGRGASLVVLDIRRFGQVNSLYGRIVGDQVLGMVAEALRTSVRVDDKVARIRDDEFAVLLEGVDDEGAAGVAERVARAVANVRPESVSGVENIVMTRLRACTAVVRSGANDDADEIVKRALGALERNKRTLEPVAA